MFCNRNDLELNKNFEQIFKENIKTTLSKLILKLKTNRANLREENALNIKQRPLGIAHPAMHALVVKVIDSGEKIWIYTADETVQNHGPASVAPSKRQIFRSNQEFNITTAVPLMKRARSSDKASAEQDKICGIEQCSGVLIKLWLAEGLIGVKMLIIQEARSQIENYSESNQE